MKSSPTSIQDEIELTSESNLYCKTEPGIPRTGQLEREGHIHSIVTQNMDLLHQKAGSKNAIEMHGSLATLSCTQCFQQVEALPYLKSFVKKDETPRGPSCGAYLIILNNSSTSLDLHADSVLQDDVANMLPTIVEQVFYG